MFFDQEAGQLIRTSNEKKEGFQDPISQAEHQQRQLTRWLQNEKIPMPPIKCLVVISQPRTILSTNPGKQSLYNTVSHPDKLLNRINKLEECFTKDVLNHKDLRKLTRQLLAKHTPHVPELMKIYDIKEEELFSGLRCPVCNYRPLPVFRGNWKCLHCRKIHKIVVEQYIKDYLLIIKSTINNTELRNILRLPSRHIALRILETSNLHPTGTKKGRVYQRP